MHSHEAEFSLSLGWRQEREAESAGWRRGQGYTGPYTISASCSRPLLRPTLVGEEPVSEKKKITRLRGTNETFSEAGEFLLLCVQYRMNRRMQTRSLFRYSRNHLKFYSSYFNNTTSIFRYGEPTKNRRLFVAENGFICLSIENEITFEMTIFFSLQSKMNTDPNCLFSQSFLEFPTLNN